MISLEKQSKQFRICLNIDYIQYCKQRINKSNLNSFNFRSKRWFEAGLKIYQLRVNEFLIPIFFADFIPEFIEVNNKNTDEEITIELKDS